MQALDAGLAFAITMLTLAMVVTTLVETLHRIFGMREKGLALLLANFYDRVLASRAAGSAELAVDRRQFIDMMTVNRGPVGRAPMTALGRSLLADARSEDRKFLNWIWSGRRLGSLGAMAFMERLGGSAYGANLAGQASAAGDKGLEWMLKDITQKFDAFGGEASEYFESRARLLSVMVGVGLAFAINVNAFTLFEAYMKRPDVTQAVIERGTGVVASYAKLQQQAAALGQTAAQVDASANPQPQAAAPASDAALQKELEASRASVKQAADEAAAAVSSLRSVGVPIGWDANSAADFWRSTPTALAGLLLGGLLIGLGAPFWYKAVQSLTAIRSVVRRDGETRETTPAAAPAQPPAGPTQTPGTPIEAFHAALGASLAAGELRLPEEAVG